MSEPAPVPPIAKQTTLDAPIERVWQALTTPDEVARWLGCLEFKPVVGHVFYMQPDADRRARGDTTGATHCELLELRAPTRLAFSWFFPDTPKTHVTLELRAEGPARTHLTLTHTGWDRFPPDTIRPVRDGLDGGWEAVLSQLRAAAER